ncbi:unnamed protein product [Phaedon cochleariae]|uniref:Uncharacterized protein n=1 Tax=Phaedon cochleariae TaxID=80249 RepID=A0A9N9X2L0_PHACE|nr:unnamed protein product [Phaedon cochleariae]
MDISMYGHFNQHSATFNSGDSNYYNNFPSGTNPPTHQFQNYYSGNYIHEETYNFASPDNEAMDTPLSSHDSNYYSPHVPENPIINTDSGLSYTNLDYSHHSSHPTNLYNQSDYGGNYRKSLGDPVQQEDSSETSHLHPTYMPENKYHMSDESYLPSPNIITSSSAYIEFQHLHKYKEEMITTEVPVRLHQHHGMHNSCSSSAQPVLPTYKWMQVKRNVPKPPGE